MPDGSGMEISEITHSTALIRAVNTIELVFFKAEPLSVCRANGYLAR